MRLLDAQPQPRAPTSFSRKQRLLPSGARMMHKVVWLVLGGVLVVSAARQPFTLRSPDFRNGAPIPAIHAYRGDACPGRNIAPTLAWAGVPPRTRSFAIVVVDPDAPKAGGW